jgi:hypothetical protein
MLGLKTQSQPQSNEPESSLIDRDIFSVLSSHLSSPTVNRVFKAEVLATIARGESVTTDLMVRSGSPEGSGNMLGGRPMAVGVSKTAAPTIQINGTTSSSAASSVEVLSGDARPRASSTLDRGAGFFSQVLSSGGRGVLKRVVSTWVPLKDADGKVDWVVLVLVPAEGECF